MGNKESNNQNINISKSEHVRIGKLSIQSGGSHKEAHNKFKDKSSTFYQEISKLLGEGNIKVAIVKLIDASGNYKEKNKQAIALLGRFGYIEAQEIKGTLNNADIRTELNGIRAAILSLAEDM